MLEVTVSAKNQITLPVDVTRVLGIEPGAKLGVMVVDRRIVLVPSPASVLTRVMAGEFRGTYGRLPDEVDAHVRMLRESPERFEWREQLQDLLYQDPDARLVYRALLQRAGHVATAHELAFETHLSLPEGKVEYILEKMAQPGWVRRLEGHGRVEFRLVRELADIVVPAPP